MDDETLYAARDPQGIRPLVLGRLERGWVVASETAALDIVGAVYIREINPGELIAIDGDGCGFYDLRQARSQGLSVRVRLPGPAPDTTISGKRLHSVRVDVSRIEVFEHGPAVELRKVGHICFACGHTCHRPAAGLSLPGFL